MLLISGKCAHAANTLPPSTGKVFVTVLLAFDLDRTLLTEDYRLPQPILDAILKARRKGHLVTVLTGRPFGSARPYIEQLQVDIPSSTNHGARIRDGAGNELRSVLMPGSFADQLVADYVDDHQMDFSAVMGDTLYVRNPDSSRWDWAHSASRIITHYQAGTVSEYDKLVFQSNHLALSVQVGKQIGQSHPQLHRYLWGGGFLEVVPEGADKGSALEYIAGKLGVPQSEVAAFGDGGNDITMVDWAGTGVAVGPEAHPEVLARSQEHIASPEEGGVADWIHRNLL